MFLNVGLAIVIIAGVFLLAGCGGGGGSESAVNTDPGDNNQPVNPGDGLPSDPSAIAAPDTNNDGTWDYVEEYINRTHANSEKARVVLTQFAKTVQNSLLDASEKELSIQHFKKSIRIMACGRYILGPEDFQRYRDELISQMINTEARFKVFVESENNSGGQMYSSVDIDEDNVSEVCGFDPNSLAN
jgi:hypothetical protein